MLVRLTVRKFKRVLQTDTLLDLDYIDLKSCLSDKQQLLDISYSDVAIRNAKNIYLLSERGYMKLIKRTVLVRFFIAYNC